MLQLEGLGAGFSVDRTIFTLEAGAVESLRITFRPTAVDPYQDELGVMGRDLEVEFRGVGVAAGKIQVDLSFHLSLSQTRLGDFNWVLSGPDFDFGRVNMAEKGMQ